MMDECHSNSATAGKRGRDHSGDAPRRIQFVERSAWSKRSFVPIPAAKDICGAALARGGWTVGGPTGYGGCDGSEFKVRPGEPVNDRANAMYGVPTGDTQRSKSSWLLIP